MYTERMYTERMYTGKHRSPTGGGVARHVSILAAFVCCSNLAAFAEIPRSPQPIPITLHCIENHVYTPECNYRFAQWIFYDWTPEGFCCVDYILLGNVTLSFDDRSQVVFLMRGRWYKMAAPTVVASNYDIELEDRAQLGLMERRQYSPFRE